MEKKRKRFSVRSKVWIEDDEGNVVFGMGRVHILNAVKTHGSLKKAAEKEGMSYRGLWGRIRATEKRLGMELLTKQVGGKKGGGSKLTPEAKELIREFTALHRDVREKADQRFEEEIREDLGRVKTIAEQESKPE